MCKTVLLNGVLIQSYGDLCNAIGAHNVVVSAIDGEPPRLGRSSCLCHVDIPATAALIDHKAEMGRKDPTAYELRPLSKGGQFKRWFAPIVARRARPAGVV